MEVTKDYQAGQVKGSNSNETDETSVVENILKDTIQNDVEETVPPCSEEKKDEVTEEKVEEDSAEEGESSLEEKLLASNDKILQALSELTTLLKANSVATDSEVEEKKEEPKEEKKEDAVTTDSAVSLDEGVTSSVNVNSAIVEDSVNGKKSSAIEEFMQLMRS